METTAPTDTFILDPAYGLVPRQAYFRDAAQPMVVNAMDDGGSGSILILDSEHVSENTILIDPNNTTEPMLIIDSGNPIFTHHNKESEPTFLIDSNNHILTNSDDASKPTIIIDSSQPNSSKNDDASNQALAKPQFEKDSLVTSTSTTAAVAVTCPSCGGTGKVPSMSTQLEDTLQPDRMAMVKPGPDPVVSDQPRLLVVETLNASPGEGGEISGRQSPMRGEREQKSSECPASASSKERESEGTTTDEEPLRQPRRKRNGDSSLPASELPEEKRRIGSETQRSLSANELQEKPSEGNGDQPQLPPPQPQPPQQPEEKEHLQPPISVIWSMIDEEMKRFDLSQETFAFVALGKTQATFSEMLKRREKGLSETKASAATLRHGCRFLRMNSEKQRMRKYAQCEG